MENKCPVCNKLVCRLGRCKNVLCTLYSHKVREPKIECEECFGSGEVMTMECYGGHPIEIWKECEKCIGEGYIIGE